MPSQLTYPGVYIEEVPSGVRTIVGVATSITALVGRARMGPVNDPTPIFSMEAFTRRFGGLWSESSLGYAVRDFFLNGGGQAIILRLHNGATTAAVQVGGLTLEASSPGTWGAELRAATDTSDVNTDLELELGTTLFNLTVRDAAPNGAVERFLNLSVDANPRNIGTVLALESQLVRLAAGGAPAAPGAAKDAIWQLEDALAATKRPGPNGEAPDPGDIATAKEALDTAVADARDAVSDGDDLDAAQLIGDDAVAAGEGLTALDRVDLVNLLCIPPLGLDPWKDVDATVLAEAAAWCERRRAVLIVDPRAVWRDASKGLEWLDQIGVASANAALYFPRLRQPDPEVGGLVRAFAPCGAVAGVLARTDARRGVWKAPAGLEATLSGVPELAVPLSDDENGQLNPLGINCLRSFPLVGRVVWGARTLQGADRLASEWKYLPIRRLALFLEESLFRGTKWVVFEPNDEPLWAQIRLNVGAFMHDQFRQGAFQGRTPREAYFVACDAETTTQSDRDRGVVNIHVGFAPLKPAEFVVIRFQQIAGQLAT